MMIQALPHYPAETSGGGSITYVGGKLDEFDPGGTTQNVSLTDLTGGSDSQPSANDLVVVAFSSLDTSDLNMSVTGYTEHCDIFETDSIDLNFGVYSKVMGGTPDTSLTVSASSIYTMVRVMVFRGVNTATPMDVAVTTGSGIDSADAIIPAITPSTTGAVVIGAAATSVGNVLNALVMGDAGGTYSTFLASKTGKISTCIGFVAWTSGAVGPTTVGGGAGSVACWAALAMALRPA